MYYRNILTKWIFIIIASIMYSCAAYNSQIFQHELGVKLADSHASEKTVTLFYNMKKLAKINTIFGHHHTTAYGIGWSGEQNRSDVKDVTGSFPGVYGWDFDALPDFYEFGVKDWMRDLVIQAYNRGGINTFAWHYVNPVTGGSFYDTTVAIKYILPGQPYHNTYLKHLDQIADYTKSLKDDSGELIPIIFRPFHEFDGSWFWWGKNFCTVDEFKELWKFTVTYLRDIKQVRNIIYAFSPDRYFNTDEEFLERYPGDEYVDIIGMDNYYDFMPDGDGLDAILKKLKIITRLAEKKNKIAAFTETGLEAIPDSLWWTTKLLNVLKQDSVNISYVLVWRNANKEHHYAPYIGHISEKDFIEFRKDPFILFEDDLPNMYEVLRD